MNKPLRYCVTNQRGWAVQDIMRRPGDPTLEMFGKYHRAFKTKRDARQHRAEMNETLRRIVVKNDLNQRTDLYVQRVYEDRIVCKAENGAKVTMSPVWIREHLVEGRIT